MKRFSFNFLRFFGFVRDDLRHENFFVFLLIVMNRTYTDMQVSFSYYRNTYPHRDPSSEGEWRMDGEFESQEMMMVEHVLLHQQVVCLLFRILMCASKVHTDVDMLQRECMLGRRQGKQHKLILMRKRMAYVFS